MGDKKFSDRITLLIKRLYNMTDNELFDEHQRMAQILVLAGHYIEFMTDEEWSKLTVTYIVSVHLTIFLIVSNFDNSFIELSQESSSSK